MIWVGRDFKRLFSPILPAGAEEISVIGSGDELSSSSSSLTPLSVKYKECLNKKSVSESERTTLCLSFILVFSWPYLTLLSQGFQYFVTSWYGCSLRIYIEQCEEQCLNYAMTIDDFQLTWKNTWWSILTKEANQLVTLVYQLSPSDHRLLEPDQFRKVILQMGHSYDHSIQALSLLNISYLCHVCTRRRKKIMLLNSYMLTVLKQKKSKAK